ncbi:MAG: PilZ domain-containing protein [Desulfobacterales bacterium]
MSAGDMLIESREFMPVGQQLTISFMRPKSRDFIKVSGQVVRTVSAGFGVKFDGHVDDIST